MAARSIPKGKGKKGGAKKGGGAVPPAKLSESALAKAIEMLDFDMGLGGGGGGAAVTSDSGSRGSARKNKGKKKKKGAMKALPKEALDAVEEALGMCWDPAQRALCLPSFFSAPGLAKHAIPDPW